MSRLRMAGLIIIFLWFSIGGVAHFAATTLEMSIVPPYIPWPRAAVLLSGVFELLGAAAIPYPSTRRVALWGLFALTIAVTPCHIYMLQYPGRFHVPYAALVARLPLQLGLLALIAWCASRERVPARPDARLRTTPNVVQYPHHAPSDVTQGRHLFRAGAGAVAMRWPAVVTDPLEGKTSLSRVFWWYTVLASLVYGGLEFFLDPGNALVMRLYSLGGFALSVYAAVATYRCAGNCKSRIVTRLARISAIGSLVLLPIITYLEFTGALDAALTGLM